MSSSLAHIVAQTNISRLSLIGLAKNAGKTTVTNQLLETLLNENLYRSEELALTSLGLDGEAIDALTGLAKPHCIPEAGLLVVTTDNLLRQAEIEGAQIERLLQLPGRTALGPVMLARVQRPGRIVIAGPTLLRDLRNALDQLHEYGTHLAIVDGAINRVGAAAPDITDACILCTGASIAATPELVAQRTAEIFQRLTTQQTQWYDAYRKWHLHIRLLGFSIEGEEPGEIVSYSGSDEPSVEACWIVARMQNYPCSLYFLRGAFTEELSRELLAQLSQRPGTSENQAELVVADATKIFCHSVVQQRLARQGLHVRVARPIRILALSLNPYTPGYVCTSRELLDALVKKLPVERPPILDVVSGLSDG